MKASSLKWNGRYVAAALTGAVLALALTAGAADLCWNGGSGDSLADPANWGVYDGSSPAGRVPGSGDTIFIIASRPLTFSVDNETDMAVVNGCQGILLRENSPATTCNVVVPPGADAAISVPIYGYERGRGTLNFSGSGTVSLTSGGKADYAALYLNIDGTEVRLPQGEGLSTGAIVYGHVAVSNGGTLHLPTGHGGSTGSNYIDMLSLSGDGTVTASEQTELRLTNGGGVFSGVLETNISLWVTKGRHDLTGTNSTMNVRSPRVSFATANWANEGSAVLGVAKIGRKGENSSLGRKNAFDTNVSGGTYVYLGEGEETDKAFYAYAHDGYSVLDAGATGGIVFKGAGSGLEGGGKSEYNCIFGLSGSNTVPCVVRGKVTERSANDLVTIVKKGTGTWRLADPALDGLAVKDNRNFRGAISVDEGVLQFDTVAPPNEYCSVGLATMRKTPQLGVWATLADVDWAFSLGGTNAALNALAEGTLEYTGTEAGLADRRPVILNADGRLRANAAKKIRYRLLPPVTACAKTLSLDGSSLATNEVHDVTDTAEHPVSVVKEGTGTWLMGGDQSFHGDLAVKGGKLIVRDYAPGTNYSWFRFTVKNLFDPVAAGGKGNVSVSFLGLFDGTGHCQTMDALSSENMLAASIEPGEAGYETTRAHSRGGYSSNGWNNDNITNLFRSAANTVFDLNMKDRAGAGSCYPRLEDESSWLPLVVRLTNGAPAVASYDWVTTYGWAMKNNGGFHWMPNVWSLEGSVDGMHWENVKTDGGDYSISTNDCASAASDGTFIFAGVAMDRDYTLYSAKSPVNHMSGCAIRGTSTNSFDVLSNVRSLRVDAGATLELENVEATFSKLAVDMSVGGGTIKGAAFAGSGSIDLLNYVRTGSQSVSIDLESSSGTSGIRSWTVSVAGQVDPRLRAKYANGVLTVRSGGMFVVVR